MSGPGQPTQDAGCQLVPISTNDGLGELTPSATKLFGRWKQESSQIQIHLEDLQQLSEILYDTGQAYEAAYEAAEEGSRDGAIVAHNAVHLIDLHLREETNPVNITRFRANLVDNARCLIFAASKLKDEFLAIRLNLMKSQDLVTKLENEVSGYRDSAAARSLRKTLASVYSSIAFVIRPLSKKAENFRNTATCRDIQSASAQKASTILEDIQKKLGDAINVVTKHIDQWSLLVTTINRLLLSSNRSVLEMHRERWGEIEEKLKHDASKAAFVKQQYKIINGDARRGTPSSGDYSEALTMPRVHAQPATPSSDIAETFDTDPFRYPLIIDFLKELDARYTGPDSRNFLQYSEKFSDEEYIRLGELTEKTIWEEGAAFYEKFCGMKKGTAACFRRELQVRIEKVRQQAFIK